MRLGINMDYSTATKEELNEAVARKLGWQIMITGNIPAIMWRGNAMNQREVPAYSTSIEAAWEIVEKVQNGNPRYRIDLSWMDGKWACRLVTDPTEALKLTFADTAPLAICLAFLKLK